MALISKHIDAPIHQPRVQHKSVPQTFADQRSSTSAQLKLQQIITNTTTQRFSNKSQPVQLTPKWLKNILRGVGLMNPSAAGGHIIPPLAPTVSTPSVPSGPQTMTEDVPEVRAQLDHSRAELETHMAAYRKARFYHSTKVENADQILKSGLDPSKRGKGGADEAQKFPTGTDPRIFLGGDHTTSLFYQNQLSPAPVETLRAFLTPSEVLETAGDINDEDSLAYWTTNAVSKDSIIRGNIIDQEQEKLSEIFAIVRQHYPEAEQTIGIDVVIDRHKACIEQGLTIHIAGEFSGKGEHTRSGKRAYQGRDNRRNSF